MKRLHDQIIKLEKIVGGGQALGLLESGKKAFIWGGLPGETVKADINKQKSSYAEGNVTEVIEPADIRVEPLDPESYLSTSPWQIMEFSAEEHFKAALIEEAFELHDIVLPNPIEVYSDGRADHYRNKVEFSFWWDKNTDQLDLAFFRRGTKGKIPIDGTSLAKLEINELGLAIRDLLRTKDVEARSLKTLLIRSDQDGNCTWQLYVKDKLPKLISDLEAEKLPAQGGEVIYSDPKSPASKITERLASFGNIVLEDKILNVKFRYATEGFFQVNIPVYEKALKDMAEWVGERPVIDMYSGVGTIGLTIGGDNVNLIEINEHAVREMRSNIEKLGKTGAKAILSPSEKAIEYITNESTIIVDPPRAGLHANVIERLLEQAPSRIIYLSCNPVTQARDVALLAEKYGIRYHRGYNFFPRTPHIENLIVLDLKKL